MTLTIEDRVIESEKKVAVLENEYENLKEVMKNHADSVEKSVKRIEEAIERRCKSDDARFDSLEKEVHGRVHPVVVVIITVLVAIIGITGGVAATLIIGG